jgi:hypothetical protein
MIKLIKYSGYVVIDIFTTYTSSSSPNSDKYLETTTLESI